MPQAGQSGVQSLTGARDFPLLQNVHPGLVAHQACDSMGTGGVHLLGYKWSGHEAVHSPSYKFETVSPIHLCSPY
jgi:hypothetical protein